MQEDCLDDNYILIQENEKNKDNLLDIIFGNIENFFTNLFLKDYFDSLKKNK